MDGTAGNLIAVLEGQTEGSVLLAAHVDRVQNGFGIKPQVRGLCSLLGLVLKSVLVDNVIESLNRRKAFIIVTAHPEIACGYITDNLVPAESTSPQERSAERPLWACSAPTRSWA